MKAFRLKAVLFDFDGTLTLPGALDFAAIRRSLGCPPEQPLLEFIAGIADGPQRRRARAALERFEAEGAAASTPFPGAQKLVHKLKSQGLRVGIISRNSLQAIRRARGPDRSLRRPGGESFAALA